MIQNNPSPDHLFCAALSRQHDEPVFGTATSFQNLILVEYSGTWGKKAFEDSDLSDAVKQHLKSQLSTLHQPRLLFIKQSEKQNAQINVFAVVNHPTKPYYNHLVFDSHDDLVQLDMAHALERQATSQTDRLYLVCTNGNKDKCCAKFGMACYKELQQHLPAQRVWQCAHVGGDRFAPNIVVAPDGTYFSGMPSEHVSDVVRAVEQGHTVPDYYRGRSWYKKDVQSAEHYARQMWGNTRLNDIEWVTTVSEDQHTIVTVRERSTGRQVVVSMVLDKRDYSFMLSCGNTEPGQPDYYRLVQINDI